MNKVMAERLLKAIKDDHDTRQRLVDAGELYGGYHPDMAAVHQRNADTLASIIADHGWPHAELVGKEAARAAYVIAMHTIGWPALQRGFRTALSAAVEAGLSPVLQLAYLGDRIRFSEGRPQRYGLVLDWDEQGELSCAIEDCDGLDERRAELGLKPWDQDRAEHLAQARAESAQPPKDLAAWREEQRVWAERVGWR